MGGQHCREGWGLGGLRSGSVLLLWCALVLFAGTCAAQGTKPLLRQASGIAYDAAGNLYMADAAAHRVWEATLGGALVPIAGDGIQGFAGDGGPALAAELNEPQGLAFGPDGTLYIADSGNHRVRAISPGGTISTFAGDGSPGFSGDGGLAVLSGLRAPSALAVDGEGALLVCDTGNQRVRRILASVIGTIAGTGQQGFAGDGGPAIAAMLDSPGGIVVAPDGRVYIADTHNQRVRVLDTNGFISTVAGSAVRGFSGDGGPALLASLSSPRGLGWTAAGELLIADEGNERIRKVSSAGVISTLAGSGVEGASSDGADGLMASLRSPGAMSVSGFGMPVFADRLNGAVRVVAGVPGMFQPAALAPGRTSGVTASAGQAITYGQDGSARVAVQGPVGVPQGQVQLAEDNAALGTTALSGATADFDLSGVSAGVHHLSATYAGDGLNPASSGSFDLSVAAAALVATASSGQVAYGSPLPPLEGVFSGVLPQDAGEVSVSFSAVAGTLPAVGTYAITASLIGPKAADYNVVMGPSSGSLQVVKAGSRVVLSSVGQSFAGVPLSLSATVASTTTGAPTGMVQFLDGTTVVASAALSGGSATAVYPAPPGGSRTLSVQYLGDGNFLPSTSPGAAVSVSPLPDFAVAGSGSLSASTAAGGVASYSVVVSSQPGPFTGAVSLSASGLPAGASTAFSPPQVVPGTGSATVVVSVQVPVSVGSAQRGPPNRRGGGSVVLAFGVVACFGLTRRRPRMGVLCVLGVTVFLSGCGARTVGEGTDGVLAQTYTIQVTGTATNLAGRVVTHSTPLTLTVQQ